MKKIILLAICIAMLNSVKSQNTAPAVKFIEVNGSAEMNLQPDEIELEINLQEYERSGKKIKLDDITNDFYKMLKKHQVNSDDLNYVSSTEFYWWYWWWHRSSYYQTRTITLKLNKNINILKLVEDLNEKWVQSIRISKSTHSKLQQYRKDVKAEAAKAAKEKAAYLLQSLGEQLGQVLSVEEVPEVSNQPNYWYRPNNQLSNSNISIQSNSNDESIGNIPSIKLRYEIKVKFAIL
ncbi:MAG: SIMPL domain-containing protein [Ferruginibacter sp.]